MSDEFYYKTDEVREACEGQWSVVLPRITHIFDEAIASYGKPVHCPLHEHKKPKQFRITSGNNGEFAICSEETYTSIFDLVMAAEQCDFATAKQLLGDAVGATQYPSRPKDGEKRAFVKPIKSSPRPISSEEQARLDKIKADQERLDRYLVDQHQRIAQTLSECVSVTDPKARVFQQYLAKRGLVNVTRSCRDNFKDIFFHPAYSLYDHEKGHLGEFPTVFKIVRDNQGKLVTLHRTFLNNDGSKASNVLDDVKRVMALPKGNTLTGASIRMGGTIEIGGYRVKGISEGMENAVSGYRGTSIPTDSTISDNGIKTYELPDDYDVDLIFVFEDKDRSEAGEKASKALIERYENGDFPVPVVRLIPPLPLGSRKGVDWNDVWKHCGVMGFPARAQLAAMVRHAMKHHHKREPVLQTA